MGRNWWLALLAFLIVTPALAQVIIQPMERAQPVQTVPILRVPDMTAEPNSDLAANVMTIEEARARIAQLVREKREANDKLKEALARIDEITQPGGSLVRAYCADEVTSRNTAGAEQKCERYTCNRVSGLCNQSATGAAMCAPGFNWVAGDRCITLGEAQQ